MACGMNPSGHGALHPSRDPAAPRAVLHRDQREQRQKL